MTTHRPPPRIPAAAAALRLPLWQRSQARMRERWGFDLNAPDARQRAEKLVAERPEDADVRLLHASVLSIQGDNDLAEPEVRRALEFQPDLARAHTTLATLLMQRGEAEQGLQEARRAAELDPDDPTVRYNVGLAEWVAGDRRAARDAFRAAWQAFGTATGTDTRPPSWWRRILHRGAPPGGVPGAPSTGARPGGPPP